VKNKKLEYLIGTIVVALLALYIWHSLTSLKEHRGKTSLLAAIEKCVQQSQKYEGDERFRQFVNLLNQIRPDEVSDDLLREFERYKQLWNQSLEHFEKTGDMRAFDKEIAESAQRLKEL
jgi:hypothetical protein